MVLRLTHFCNSSVKRQNGESQNGRYKKTKHTKFYEERTFFTLRYAHGHGLLCFLATPVLRFAVLPYYRQTVLVTLQAGNVTLSMDFNVHV